MNVLLYIHEGISRKAFIAENYFFKIYLDFLGEYIDIFRLRQYKGLFEKPESRGN